MGRRRVSVSMKGLCRCTWALMAALVLPVVPAPLSGQHLDPRLLWNRVQVIDRMAAPFPSAAAASGFIARFAGGAAWAPFGACIGEQTAREEWIAAVDEARRLLDDAALQLAPLPPRSPFMVSTTSLPVRDIVHERLSRLPPAITATFRKEADAAASKLIEQWRLTSSAEPLRRVVREFGISPRALEAADILGDLAFEAGAFEEAFAWWNTKHLDADAGRAARRRTKQILARIFLDRFDEAERDVQRIKREEPAARGTLAGRSGAYIDILTHWLDLRRGHGDEDQTKPWPTFAGAATRNRVFAAPLAPRLWNQQHTWRTSLPAGKQRVRDIVSPIISDGQVFSANPQEIVSHDLATGDVRFRYREPDAAIAGKAAGFTSTMLHAAPGCVYAVRPTALLCLDTGRDVPQAGNARWRVSARDADGQAATFTSAPLVADNHVFVVVTATNGLRAQHYLACHTLRRGARLWCMPLYEGPADAGPPKLLTWAGDRLVYATHQGQVLAVDPATGHPLWAVRYPSQAGRAGALEPLPAVYDAGRVVVAPRDGPRLLCIETATGRVAWELPKADVIALVGIADGMAVFTTRHGIEAIDVRTGGGEQRWRQPGSGRLPTAGRGLLAGPLIYWPTHDERLPLRTLVGASGSTFAPVFAQRLDPSRFHALPAGNFAFGERSLAIGTRDEVIVFTPRQAGESAFAPKGLQHELCGPFGASDR